MNEFVRNELKNITDIIVKLIPVENIFLFGSYATGRYEADSDLDIYIVMPDGAEIREIDAMKLVRRAIRDQKTLPIDILVSKEKRFNNRMAFPTLEKRVIEEGMTLYG